MEEIYAEGCSGEIDGKFTHRFNGWTLGELKNAVSNPDYPEIVSNVPLKLEAKYGKKLRTLCGDDEKLIQANDLAFSDARGAVGFLTRLTQYRDDPKRAKNYLEGVIELYKLPANASAEDAIARLKIELKAAVARAQDLIEKRNAKLVERVLRTKQSSVAVVFGGSHSAGLVRLLEEAGLGCSVVEPVGYQNDEGTLLRQLEEALGRL